MEFKDLAGLIIAIAKDAGNAVMKIYQERTDFEVENKADRTPLTIADRQSNAVICDGLAGFDARIPIISEENKAVPYDVRKHYKYYWLVDPLDGTKEFIKRNGEFTVNIALIRQGIPVLGVVYAPALEELYWAIKGQGAFSGDVHEARKLEALPFKLTDNHLKVVCSRSHLNEATQAFVAKLSDPLLLPKGSSLKFLMVADGQAHLYPRLGPTMEWDTAAAQIVLEEAGGKVIDTSTKQPLAYNKENLRNPDFVAYGRVAD